MRFRKVGKPKFPDIERGPMARNGKEMGFLNHASVAVNRWQWPDQVIFWTWRDQQAEFFAGQRRVMWTKRMIVGTVALIVIGLMIWAIV
jgi:hypothetical protein